MTLASASKIYVPEDCLFSAITKGIKNKIYFEKNGAASEPFSVPDAENNIELNGMKSELCICVSNN